MKLAAKLLWRQRGKAIELNSESETMKLISPTGELLGARSREAVMDFVQLPRPTRRPHDQPLLWGTSTHPQPFEHTFASRVVMAGVDIRIVQDLMGHSTITMITR